MFTLYNSRTRSLSISIWLFVCIKCIAHQCRKQGKLNTVSTIRFSLQTPMVVWHPMRSVQINSGVNISFPNMFPSIVWIDLGWGLGEVCLPTCFFLTSCVVTIVSFIPDSLWLLLIIMIEKNKIKKKNLKKKFSLVAVDSKSENTVCPFPLISGVEYGSKIPDVKIWQGKVPLSWILEATPCAVTTSNWSSLCFLTEEIALFGMLCQPSSMSQILRPKWHQLDHPQERDQLQPLDVKGRNSVFPNQVNEPTASAIHI